MTAREITAVEAAILGWALDGDFIELWATGWAPDAEPPFKASDRRLDETRAAALQLVRDDLLEVSEVEQVSKGAIREHAVDRAKWETILSDPRNWGTGDPERDALSRERHFCLAGTEAGTRAWLEYAERNGLIGFRRFDRVTKKLTARLRRSPS